MKNLTRHNIQTILHKKIAIAKSVEMQWLINLSEICVLLILVKKLTDKSL